MSITNRLRIVDQRVASVSRQQRIDALSVDRSMFKLCPMPILCPEAQAYEARLEDIRAHTTMAERMHAYRWLAEVDLQQPEPFWRRGRKRSA